MLSANEGSATTFFLSSNSIYQPRSADSGQFAATLSDVVSLQFFSVSADAASFT